MLERRKQNYEAADLEILVLNSADILTTSGFDKYVDTSTSSWVDPNADDWR
ncbi:MAG: hypothetical protein IJX92_02520 [Clostridia bacterium]|nr:hypothetical protein [Clostridia bacterium]